MAEAQAVLLSDEETEHLIRIMDTIRRIQKVVDQCLEAATEQLAQLTEIAARHEAQVHASGELVQLRVSPPDVTPPARSSQD